MNREEDYTKLVSLLDARHEWLLIRSSGAGFALDRNEIEVEQKRGAILFGFLDEKGFQTWRVTAFDEKRGEIILSLTRNFEKEREKIRLVPRISSKELSDSVEIARAEKANRIAHLLIAEFPSKKLVRVGLNKENGRFAQIFIEGRDGKQTAVLTDVSGELTPETHLTTAILWHAKLEKRKRKPISEIWIVADKKLFSKLRKLHALLKEIWKDRIILLEIFRQDAKAKTESIIRRDSWKSSNLWREKKKIAAPRKTETSRTAREIVKSAPDKIDVAAASNGETLRFFGLPFARVRTISGEEKCWFGIEREKRVLNENSRTDFYELHKNLGIYRRFDAPNKQHAFYNLAPEAWLEAILRKNIKTLDHNLILSPLYHQFRAGRDQIDLLALRRDGRLIIIEIKVAPDREMIYQAADYWRKVELSRRAGDLRNIKLFGDLPIADAPPIVYLVAPTLSFHRDFKFLARTISTEIEIFRFNLNESWRENLQVMSVEEIK